MCIRDRRYGSRIGLLHKPPVQRFHYHIGQNRTCQILFFLTHNPSYPLLISKRFGFCVKKPLLSLFHFSNRAAGFQSGIQNNISFCLSIQLFQKQSGGFTANFPQRLIDCCDFWRNHFAQLMVIKSNETIVLRDFTAQFIDLSLIHI